MKTVDPFAETRPTIRRNLRQSAPCPVEGQPVLGVQPYPSNVMAVNGIPAHRAACATHVLPSSEAVEEVESMVVDPVRVPDGAPEPSDLRVGSRVVVIGGVIGLTDEKHTDPRDGSDIPNVVLVLGLGTITAVRSDDTDPYQPAWLRAHAAFSRIIEEAGGDAGNRYTPAVLLDEPARWQRISTTDTDGDLDQETLGCFNTRNLSLEELRDEIGPRDRHAPTSVAYPGMNCAVISVDEFAGAFAKHRVLEASSNSGFAEYTAISDAAGRATQKESEERRAKTKRLIEAMASAEPKAPEDAPVTG